MSNPLIPSARKLERSGKAFSSVATLLALNDIVSETKSPLPHPADRTVITLIFHRRIISMLDP